MSTLLYLESSMLIVSKPAGQPVQSKDKRVETVVAEWRQKLDEPVHAVHRIDQPVSGLVVLARSPETAPSLFAAFKERQVGRTYLAVVDKEPPEPEGDLVDAIVTDAQKNKSTIDARGKASRLSYRMIGRTDHHSVLLVRLDTGRHHQIRAQLAAHGMHVIGDAKYGARRSLRDRSIALHAWRITVPTVFCASSITVTAPLPPGSLWRAVGSLLDVE